MDSQFERTRQFWGAAIRNGNLIYPNDQVIRFIKRNYKNQTELSILDFGCGGGRNTAALVSEGYHVIAMDYTESAIEMTREKCKRIGADNTRIIKNTGFDIPLPEESIDAVVADGSLFYYSKNDIIHVVANLQKVMRKGGLLWTDFRTKRDSLYGKGKQLDNGLYELGNATGREGCAYYFADEKDVREIFFKAGLEILSIDDYSYTENNRNGINSWYHVIARK